MGALASCGILLVVISFLLVFETLGPAPDVVASSSIVVLAQSVAAGWHLLYERRKALARSLGLMAPPATVVFWLALLLAYFLWFAPNPSIRGS